ncbi:MAG: hypothetical protein DSY80_00545 [Desulfocapsa sp.]|nr:MAG: hypothetical protein DSY80_00545 [Desulfocapsa sp.]
MNNELVPVPFHDDTIHSIKKDGVVYFVPRTICNNLGLNWSAQFRRIKRDDMLGSTVAVMATVADDGKIRETVCLPKKFLNSWLTTINAKRVRPETREALLAYKLECAEVLDSYWEKGAAINPRIVSQPSIETILKAVEVAKGLYGYGTAQKVWEELGLPTDKANDASPIPLDYIIAKQIEEMSIYSDRMIKIRDIFIRSLQQSIWNGEVVFHRPSLPNYAPLIFAKKYSTGITEREFTVIMDDLLKDGKIVADDSGALGFACGWNK